MKSAGSNKRFQRTVLASLGPPLNRGVMRNKICLAVLLASTACSADDLGGTVIDIFDAKVRLPSTCVLYARPSVIDQDTRFFCDIAKGSVVHIYIKKSSACIAQIEAKDRVVQDRKVIRGHERARSESRKAPQAHQWLAWDKDVCLMALSDSENALSQIMAPVWQ